MTRNAQLSTFVTSMVVLDAVSRTGAEAAAHAGHSLGEYSALCAAGVLDYAAAAKLVNDRGDAMQAAADTATGTMAAVLGLDDDKVDLACRRTDGDVWVANYNAPGQVVIAGSPDDLDRACAAAKELGAKRAMRIPVGGAFHSPLMAPPRSASQGNRPGRVPQRRTNRLLQRRCHGAHRRRRLRRPSRRSAHLARPVAPDAPGARDRQLHDLRRTRSRHRPHRPGQAGGRSRRTGQRRRRRRRPPGTLGQQDRRRGTATVLEEHLAATERMVVPGAGIFTPNESCVDGSIIEVGQLLGTVGPAEVRSSFAATSRRALLRRRAVTSRQPIAWLRTTAWCSSPASAPPFRKGRHQQRPRPAHGIDAWIRERSGIGERRVGGSVDMAVDAAGRHRRCGSHAGRHWLPRVVHHHAREDVPRLQRHGRRRFGHYVAMDLNVVWPASRTAMWPPTE